MRTKEEFTDGFIVTRDLEGPYLPICHIETMGELISYLVKNKFQLIAVARTPMNCYIIIL